MKILILSLTILLSQAASSQQIQNIKLTMNSVEYKEGDNVHAEVKFSGTNAPKYQQYVVFVSPETGDIEALNFKSLSSKKLAAYGTLKILIGLRPVKNDGQLTVKPGGKVHAYYYKKDLKGGHPNTILAADKKDMVMQTATISTMGN